MKGKGGGGGGGGGVAKMRPPRFDLGVTPPFRALRLRFGLSASFAGSPRPFSGSPRPCSGSPRPFRALRVLFRALRVLFRALRVLFGLSAFCSGSPRLVRALRVLFGLSASCSGSPRLFLAPPCLFSGLPASFSGSPRPFRLSRSSSDSLRRVTLASATQKIAETTSVVRSTKATPIARTTWIQLCRPQARCPDVVQVV